MNGGHQCTHFLSVCGLWNHLSFSLLNMYILQVFTKVVCTFIPILYLEKCHSENFAFTLSRLAHFVSLNGLAPSKSDHFIPQHNHTLTLLDHSLSIETPAPLWLDHLLALNSHALTWTILWCCFIVIGSFFYLFKSTKSVSHWLFLNSTLCSFLSPPVACLGWGLSILLLYKCLFTLCASHNGIIITFFQEVWFVL